MSRQYLASRCWRLLWILIAIFLIAACASTTRPSGPFGSKTAFGPEATLWQGRIAVKVASLPEQAFSANFELEGSSQIGRMELTTPLGTTVARMQWNAEGAELQTGSTTRAYPSLADLTLATMGAELPVEALFQWLRGESAPSAGWQADLSHWDAGRISAQRHAPAPRVDLKILLEF